MPTSQSVCCEPSSGHGGPRASLAELRRRLARPSRLDHGHRQRLLELTQRLARVRELGAAFGRVECSGYVSAALSEAPAVV
jgi:hypothetical protein